MYKTSDFNKEQLREIEDGIKQGVKVSIYAKPVYNFLQMRELKLGLIHGVKVVYFANPEFNWLQMQEIRLGMESGINFRAYAKPRINSFKMRDIREKLEEESECLCGDKYCRKDYDLFQWCVMKYGVSKGIDITPLANPDFSCGQMMDILNELKS